MKAKNALILMRSRYSAYALSISKYIIETTHPANLQHIEKKSDWKRSIDQFSRSFSFNNLEIVDFQEAEKLATVTFIASISNKEGDATFTERSCFEKIGDHWLYRAGEKRDGRDESLMQQSPLRLLPIAYYGNPILEKKAEPIHSITQEIRALIDDMIFTMDSYHGIGIAAPQVFHSIRLFIIKTPKKIEDGTYSLGDIEVFINPELSQPSVKTCLFPEGCLSIPGIRKEIRRPESVSVTYTKLDGSRVTKQFSGLKARIIFHENDHIEGTLFIDHLDKKEQEAIKRHLEKQVFFGAGLALSP